MCLGGCGSQGLRGGEDLGLMFSVEGTAAGKEAEVLRVT